MRRIGYAALALVGAALFTNCSDDGGPMDPPDTHATVRINEVESQDGTPGDWVELYNTAATPANMSGYILRDNMDGRGYTLPAGTMIAANGFLVIDEDSLDFGLGAADNVRLFAPDGTIVDAFEWTAHAATTYGRCPDGTGAFRTTTVVTKGAANDCRPLIRINEIESNGGSPGDWVELYNPDTVAVNLAGWVFKDNDDTHAYTLPGGSTIAAGGYFLIEEAAMGFGLGAPDAARLFRPDTSLSDAHDWTTHATTTYGRCPNGTGEFSTTSAVSKGAANVCGTTSSAIRINEIESSGGTPGDWVELYNTGTASVDLAGWIIKDEDDTHVGTLPPGSVIAAGGFLVVEESTLGFGLGTPDAVRLFDPSGTLIDSYSWTPHATTTYGRCPDGTGEFTTTTSVTKGAANDCGTTQTLAWPGTDAVQTVDSANVFGGNMSGLTFDPSANRAPGVLYAARNGPGSLFRLLWNGSVWAPDTANSWGSGKALRYPDGTGDPDAESVTFAGDSTTGIYVATERNNAANSVSRNSILRFDVAATGNTLIATHEWNLTADLPVVGPNLGLEAITWVPNDFLVAQNFFDESKGRAYAPADYPNHGGGLFFVGVEGNGMIYAYALNDAGGAFTRVATIASGFAGVMGVEFDRELQQFWAICDDTCGGLSSILQVDSTGRFVVTHTFARPASMPNLNNEGFAIGWQAQCVGNQKPVFWTDDSATGGHALRRATVPCTRF